MRARPKEFPSLGPPWGPLATTDMCCTTERASVQQLSRAVVMYDARALAKQITCLKQELRGRAAQAAPAGVGGA